MGGIAFAVLAMLKRVGQMGQDFAFRTLSGLPDGLSSCFPHDLTQDLFV